MDDGILTPREEAFAAALAQGLTQAEAYRRAFPHCTSWKERTVYSRASEMAARGDIQGRVKELGTKAARVNEVTIEQVVSELRRVAFGDLRQVMTWGPSGVELRESSDIGDDGAAAIAEVAETRTKDGGSLKVKRHDKVKALELLGRYLGAFEKDNSQRPQGAVNVYLPSNGR